MTKTMRAPEATDAEAALVRIRGAIPTDRYPGDPDHTPSGDLDLVRETLRETVRLCVLETALNTVFDEHNRGEQCGCDVCAWITETPNVLTALANIRNVLVSRQS